MCSLNVVVVMQAAASERHDVVYVEIARINHLPADSAYAS
jgi:hypothetical protein